MRTNNMRRFFLAFAALGLLLSTPLQAQSLFSPAIRVNDRAITWYELDQRALLLKALNVPGDPDTEARNQLIEERLKQDAAAATGIQVSEEMLTEGTREFAGRANMDPDKLFTYLDQNGIARETFIAFMQNGLLWREVVRARFSAKSAVTDADIDKAMNALNSGNSAQVLLSEIWIPVPQGQEAQAMALAEELSQDHSPTGFAANAREYSVAKTRDQGGRLGWMPLTKLPPALRPVILALKPGEVTRPLPLQNAVALFQLRSIAESEYRAPAIAAIEYATLLIPGGRTPEALAEAQKIISDTDSCDDLYGKAKGQPEEILTRSTQKPGDIPQDIAIELAKLDKGEFSTLLTRNNGQTLVLLMMCGRTPTLTEDASREEITAQLRNRRLESLAAGYLEQLRADARIIEE
ncbi:peptidylprolyl isomerase [Thalassovita sp.]|uniref:peptidylprolyl isomerase n=1 Tax=Thalassovita sp. TaxID=1979401 RepID=UPI0029DE85E9|nr:peptidylprolyl isomerase [Thalassovita sp.]